MSNSFPQVEVAAVLIVREDKVLLTYNPLWRAFTLPMTKLGQLPPATPNSPATLETPQHAAIRAATEALGRPLSPASFPVLHLNDPAHYDQSDRDGQWKRYTYHLFILKLSGSAAAPTPVDGVPAVWLSRAEIETHEPISKTARHLVGLAEF